MTRFAVITATAALLAATATTSLAEARPAPATAPDPRIKTVDYDPDQVVRMVGVLRTASQIRFGADETIEHVALGDSAGWEVAPEANILFAKPLSARATTNLLVTTRTGAGNARHYIFELSARSGPASRNSPNTYFAVQFRYPAQETALVQAALSAEAQALEARILRLKLERGVLEGARNLAYELQGSRAIAPSEVSDNGRFTVLRFPGVQAMPVVYAVSPDGTEGLVPFDVRGEFLVVHQAAAQLRLRRGREVLCVFNLAFRADTPTAGTATASEAVQRTLKPETQP